MLKRSDWKLLFAVLVLMATLALASCGSGSSSMPTTTGGTNAVTIGDNFFSPNSMTVTTGTMVVWTWTGSNQHTVTSGSPGIAAAGAMFDSPRQSSGTFQFTFNQTGTFPYFCRIHGAAMEGTITVVAGGTMGSGGGGY